MPLIKSKPLKPFSVCDIESRNWIEFLIIGHFDGKRFRHFDNLKDFFEYCFSHDHDTIFAHFGGIFDFLFLLNHALGDSKYRLESIIPRGSGILCFTLEKGKRRITFRDSSALLPFSLRRITESFGVNHVKQTINYTKIKKVTPKLIEYLKHDCVGLHESLEKFYEGDLIKKAGQKFTIASQALQVFRTFLKNPIPQCPGVADKFVRRAYAGGRTEIFKPYFNSKSKKLYCYDVNSLYPFQMAEHEYPLKFEGFSTKLDLKRMGFVEATVFVPEDTYIPLLWKKEGKFIFPVGTFSGIWATCELNEAIKNGAKILSSGKCAYFSNGGKIFSEFVEHLYFLRKNSKSEVEKTTIKLILNSLYGRMGLNLEREGLELDHGQTGVIPHFELKIGEKIVQFVKKDIELESFSNVAIAAWVTAKARIHGHRIMSKMHREIYYTDTDSFFTTKKMPTSNALGELKLEYTSRKACFLLPKTYKAGNKIAMKGFDKKKIKNFTHADFKVALEGDLRILKTEIEPRMFRFKSALRVKKLLSMSPKSERGIKSLYDKRKIFRDSRGNWDTKPILLCEEKGNENANRNEHDSNPQTPQCRNRKDAARRPPESRKGYTYEV